MLKRLIRGWWTKGGMGQGFQNEGCRGEGDQPGYIASGHLHKRVLSAQGLRSQAGVQRACTAGGSLLGPGGGGRGGRGPLRLRSQSGSKFWDRRCVAVPKESGRLECSKLHDGDRRFAISAASRLAGEGGGSASEIRSTAI